MRSLEVQRQQDFIQNCGTIMSILKEQQKDYILEQIIQMDESVQAICTDVQACRNLRA